MKLDSFIRVFAGIMILVSVGLTYFVNPGVAAVHLLHWVESDPIRFHRFLSALHHSPQTGLGRVGRCCADWRPEKILKESPYHRMKAPALFSLLGISVLTGCGPTPAPLDGENSSAIEVRTAMVRSELQPQFQSVSGLIRPQASATVAAKVMGTITQAKLAVGQPVSSG